jgi:molybdopterin molybdotransferase
VIGIDEAVQRVLAAVRPLGAEEIGLLDALGRTLADEVVAGEDVPPFANSAMDGFAVRGDDLRSGLREFVLVDEVPAGYVSQVRLAPGQAAKIMTGAPLPDGADTVVPVELTEAAGEDLRRGDAVFAAGQGLGPAEIGLLASLGHDRVRVARRPRVAILATGSELVPLGQPVGPGQIRNSNSYTANGQVLRAGGEPVLLGIARDDREETRRLVARALEEDVAITSGGVSVGEFDFVKEVQDELGVERGFWGVRVKPGKPISFGVRDATLVFGVPGNPVAAMVCFELYVRPALLAMQGRSDVYRPAFTAVSEEPVAQAAGRVEARRCRLAVRGGAWTFSTTGPQGSGILRSMALADGLVFVPTGFGGGPAGTPLTVMLLGGSSTQRPPYPE